MEKGAILLDYLTSLPAEIADPYLFESRVIEANVSIAERLARDGIMRRDPKILMTAMRRIQEDINGVSPSMETKRHLGLG